MMNYTIIWHDSDAYHLQCDLIILNRTVNDGQHGYYPSTAVVV